eukprot:CAMPEP_0181218168 /NCGR_PEP_ID=MMETSP1096-20121128/27545_1 /TAXON_ID=156174 ORGANISM="Chrysochromulina ericina, Strain CCMP281" /NCGR_SAMPLE_ID=MMETSP1096 /ASSEMBLY_ACC=CAM_ASM_000453 /LENGTH=60 /DNA_ID=CAMNT_0023310357 /DNA_START=150 /DNA_END=332 /DNA_ORIENTATION=+
MPNTALERRARSQADRPTRTADDVRRRLPIGRPLSRRVSASSHLPSGFMSCITAPVEAVL